MAERGGGGGEEVLSDGDDLCTYAKMLRQSKRKRERKKKSFLGMEASPAFLCSADLLENWATEYVAQIRIKVNDLVAAQAASKRVLRSVQ